MIQDKNKTKPEFDHDLTRDSRDLHQRLEKITKERERKKVRNREGLQEQEEEQGEKQRRICGDESAVGLLLPIQI